MLIEKHAMSTFILVSYCCSTILCVQCSFVGATMFLT